MKTEKKTTIKTVVNFLNNQKSEIETEIMIHEKSSQFISKACLYKNVKLKEDKFPQPADIYKLYPEKNNKNAQFDIDDLQTYDTAITNALNGKRTSDELVNRCQFENSSLTAQKLLQCFKDICSEKIKIFQIFQTQSIQKRDFSAINDDIKKAASAMEQAFFELKNAVTSQRIEIKKNECLFAGDECGGLVSPETLKENQTLRSAKASYERSKKVYEAQTEYYNAAIDSAGRLAEAALACCMSSSCKTEFDKNQNGRASSKQKNAIN